MYGFVAKKPSSGVQRRNRQTDESKMFITVPTPSYIDISANWYIIYG
jgi:hypothetical protein